MRQGNDIGTQYRSAIYTTTDDQARIAEATRAAYEEALSASRKGTITTEIAPAPEFYYAEEYHQQYLHKVPNGYCGSRDRCQLPNPFATANAAASPERSLPPMTDLKTNVTDLPTNDQSGGSA
jgi:peptide methionine sulfoxide reductase MsrA